MAGIKGRIITADGGLALCTVLGLLKQLRLIALEANTVVVLALNNLSNCFFGSVERPG